MNQPHPNDGSVMRSYTERYAYDTAGNLLQMTHIAADGNWTRRYEYEAASNRLRSSSLPGDPIAGPYSAAYDYDAHGNMIRMPHLSQMDWDFRNQLHRVDLGGGGEAYYVYNVNGMRVRKIVERPGGSRQERIYLGGYEVYREYQGATLQLERQSLGIMDNERRIALIETKTIDGGVKVATPKAVTRYQFSNRQFSACLELDDAGKVISYEEYYPFGNTSCQAVDASVDVSRKRYRYMGRERDAETGLSYYLARYYSPWLARWTSCDPAGLQDGVNTYAYARNNPLAFSDCTGTKSDEEKPGQLLDLLKIFGIPTDRDSEKSSSGIFGAIGDFFGSLWSGIKTIAGAIGGAIAAAASAVWNRTKGAVETAWNWIKNAAAAAWEWTKNAVSAAWNWIKNAAAAAWEWTKNAASAVWNWTKNAAVAAWGWSKRAASAAWEWTKKVAGAVWNWTKRAGSAAWDWIKNAAAAVWDWTKRAAAVIWSGFKTVVGFTWNWILAPLIRTATNAALGFLVGGIAGAIAGAFLGAFHGWAMASAHSYDWASLRGWTQFLADNTWSLPNSAVGSLFATINIIGGNEIDSATSKDTGELYFKGQWFPPFDTTLGNVTVGTVVPVHEREHAFQARLFGPLFYPLVIGNYAVATVLPYWIFYHDFAAHPIKSVGDYFKCGVYPHTWHEEWAYSVQGGTC
jgi:RHS repeat-associated protein